MQQLILLKYVEALGRPGLIVKVRDGFAQNYLLPQGLAVRATEDNMRRLQGLRERFEQEEKERESSARKLGEKLEAVTLTIPMKASEEGKLYGSVNAAMLVDLLKEQGCEVELRAVRLAEPIKEIGRYDVPVTLHEEVKLNLKVYVVEEKEVPAEPAATEAAT